MMQPPGPERMFYARALYTRLFAYIVGPLLAGGVALGIYTTARVVTTEEERPAELVARMRDGAEHERWQAAFALARSLGAETPERHAVQALTPELVSLFERERSGDAPMRRYLALALGRLGDRRAVPALVGALAADDAQLVSNSLVALGLLRAAVAVPQVIAATEHDRAEVRAIATYVLGLLGTEPGLAHLAQALTDTEPSVRWNAAFGLARHDDPRGEAVIAEILARGSLYQAVGTSAAERRELFLNAVRSAGRVRTPLLVRRLQQVAKTDDDVEARRAAMRLLESPD